MTKKLSQADVEAIFMKHSMKVLGKYVNSTSPLKSKCLICGNTISPRLDKVNQRGHQCGYCSGKLGGEKRAIAKLKELGHKPLEPYPGAVKPWKIKCGGCGKIISPIYASIQRGDGGCKFCGHARAGAKRREIRSTVAIEVMRKAFCEPLVPYPGINSPWKSRCMKCDSLIQPRLAGIQSGQGGCPKCGIKARAKARTYTQDQAQKIAIKKQMKPLEPYQGSSSKWKCECLRCGKISSPHFSAIRDGKYGCLWCAKKIVDPSNARKLMEKAGLIPLVAYPGSDRPWLSTCKKCSREVSPTYGSIRAGQGGCRWCKSHGAHVDPLFAVQVLLSNNIQPLEPFKSSHSKWKSRCLRCEREIAPSFHDIKQGSSGCRFCAPNFVDEQRIAKVMKAAGLSPLETYPGSKAAWKVRHEQCGRSFRVKYANLRKGGSCRYCAGKAVIPSEAVALMKKSGIQPLVKYPGASKPWKSKCLVCLKVISPRFTSVSSRKSGCIYCTGHKVDIIKAKKLMLDRNLKPLEAFPGAAKKWKCLCLTCNREVTPMYTSIQRGQGGCKFCANWGIDYGANGFLYLMTNKSLSAHKLGIGNSARIDGSRISQHEKNGWELYKKLEFEVTDDAFKIEQEVLIWLRRDRNLDAYLSEFEMPQGGYSETVDASEIDLPTIWAKVSELSKVYV